MIIFDGKGERDFLDRLLPHIEAAGRLQDLRVIDPTHPSESARYNPFYALDDAYQEHVNFIFRSFGLREDFFKGHQEAYLSDLCRRLDVGKAASSQRDLSRPGSDGITQMVSKSKFAAVLACSLRMEDVSSLHPQWRAFLVERIANPEGPECEKRVFLFHFQPCPYLRPQDGPAALAHHQLNILASSAEVVGRFWFRESS